MWVLRQSTAGQEIPLGPFVDDGDGVTPATGLTIANTDIKLQKNGATTQANKNSGGATHIATGDYYAVLDATDSDTVGPMRVKVAVAGALPVWLDCCVLEEAVYDALYGSGAAGYQVPIWSSASATVSLTNTTVATVTAVTNTVNANAVQVSGDSTAADNLEALLDGTGGVTLVASAITLTTPVTANVTQISGDSTAADNLESYTDGTTPMPVNATQVSGSATAADNVEQVFSTDFADAYDGTNNVWNANVTLSDGEAVSNYEGALASATASTVTFPATDALGNAVPESPDYAEWKEIQVGANTRLVLGEWVSGRTFEVHEGDGTGLGGENYIRLNDVRVNVTALSDGGLATQVGGNIAAAFSNLFGTADSARTVIWNAAIRTLTAATNIDAAVADAVWDEALAGHAAAGSAGEALSAAGGAGDPWITSLPGSYTAGQAGFILGTNLNATVSSRASQTSVDTIAGYLDTEVAAIKAKTDQLTFTETNQVDANAKSINDTAVNGTGVTGDKWRGA